MTVFGYLIEIKQLYTSVHH